MLQRRRRSIERDYLATTIARHAGEIDRPRLVNEGECIALVIRVAGQSVTRIGRTSQNRQDTKDRLRGELDYAVNRRSESEIQGLARKLNVITDKLGDLENLVRVKA